MPLNTAIELDEGTTEIATGAFNRCSGLTSVTIPNSVTSIGEGAFAECRNLTSLIIPEGVTSIGRRAFYRCSGLTSIIVESGNIVYDSRNNCNAIISTADDALILGCGRTRIPRVRAIGDEAFAGCSGLYHLQIPNGVRYIGAYAFEGCDVEEVIIPRSVEYIYSSPFRACDRLYSIIVEEGNPVFDSRDNCNAIIRTADNEFISGCDKTIIPNSVTSIGDEAFAYCYYLTTVTIPNSVISIGYYAFNECNRLTNLYCYAKEIPQITPGTFGNNSRIFSKATLHVPVVSLDAYKAAWVWANFKNIVGIGDASGDGTADASDIIEMLNYIMGNPSEVFDERAADLNGDGIVNAADIVKLVNLLMGN